MNQSELKNKDNQNNQLTDLEPNNEVVGGAAVQSGFGYAVLTVGGQTTIRSGATLQIQGGITVTGEGLNL
jgi:hypothetical protein